MTLWNRRTSTGITIANPRTYYIGSLLSDEFIVEFLVKYVKFEHVRSVKKWDSR